jgi:hypothetical protein
VAVAGLVILVATVLVTGSASAAPGAASVSVGKQEVSVADDAVQPLFDNRALGGGLGAVEKLPFDDMSRPDDPPPKATLRNIGSLRKLPLQSVDETKGPSFVVGEWRYGGKTSRGPRLL